MIGVPVRSNNPVLARSDAFTPGYQQANYQNGYGQAGTGYGYNQPGYQQGFEPAAPAPTSRMTMNDVIAKTATLFVVLLATAAVAWFITPVSLLYPVAIIASLLTLIPAIFVTMRRVTSVPAIMAYAGIEGIFLGAWSRIFEYTYPGIVAQAVLGTLVATAVTLAGYRYLGARVQGRLAKIVVFSIIGYAGVALINFIVVMAGGSLGLTTVGSGAGPLSWLFAGIGVVLAVASLLMDFEEIERGVRMGAPAEQAWYASFGLMVTLVWLYTNLLRILSFFRD